MTTSTGSLDNINPIGVRLSSSNKAPCSRRNIIAFSRLWMLGASMNGNLNKKII
jgi:hypothetical protein